ncbi:MAG: GEVED domain-containing protein, partial [Rubripirellula sp.]
PAPYPVTLAERGASHAPTGPMIGVLRDAETDGQHSVDATADGSDEDGVLFGVAYPGQIDAKVLVDVSNAPEGAFLDGWIDFDQDGTWSSTDERIFSRMPVAEGSNTLHFDVPTWAPSDQLYARLRISSAGVDGPTGIADDGEVQDHTLAVSAPPKSLQTFDAATTLIDDFSIHQTIDFDGDGDIDFIGVNNAAQLLWYEQTTTANFISHSMGIDGIKSQARAADLDRDGDLDVVVSRGQQIVGVLNAGDGTFSSYNLGPATNNGSYTQIEVADFGQDGDWDVVTLLRPHNGSPQVWVLEQTTSGWASHLANERHDSRFSDVVDIDQDGDLDITYVSHVGHFAGHVGWLRNDGELNFNEVPLTTTWGHPTVATGVDFDEDGDIDILASGPSQMAREIELYLNDGNENFTQVIPQSEITPHTFGVNSVVPADLAGDGNFDILWGDWWGKTIGWIPHSTTSPYQVNKLHQFPTMGASVNPADLDQDGDIDFVGTLANHQWAGPAGNDYAYWIENVSYVTLDRIADASMERTLSVPLSGIGSNRPGGSTLRITVSSSNSGLIPDPIVDYTSPDSTGNLTFTRISPEAGVSLITVTVEDSGADGDLSTASNNVRFSRDFVVTVDALPFFDFGDAPTSYPVLRSEDGARHSTGNIYLGTEVDVELDGVHSNDATGDGADDDGVVLENLVAGKTGVARVTVANAAGKLDAWIDFNADGDWDDAGEQIYTSQAVNVGLNELTFELPTDAVLGETFARFRVSSAGGLAPRGAANDGEVEDYRLEITPNLQELTRVYWADDFSIRRGLENGNQIETIHTNTGNQGRMLFDIDRANQKLVTASYHAQDQNAGSWIHAMDMDGSDRTMLRDTGWPLGVVPHAVTVSNATGDIYYSPHALENYHPANRQCFCPGGMQQLSSDGSTLTTYSQRPWYVSDMEVDEANGHVYYTVHPTFGGGPVGFAGIRRMNVDGTNDIALLNTGGGSWLALDIPGSKIYYAENTLGVNDDGRTLYRANLDGTGVETVISDVGGGIGDIELDSDNGRLVWVRGGGSDGNILQSANLDGSGLTTLFSIGSGGSPIALESVQVASTNHPPTIDEVSDLTLFTDSEVTTIPLAGISDGDLGDQNLRITTTSSNPELLQAVNLSYEWPADTGQLQLTPSSQGLEGTTIVSVVVEDGGLDRNLETPDDNLVTTMSFSVEVVDPWKYLSRDVEYITSAGISGAVLPTNNDWITVVSGDDDSTRPSSVALARYYGEGRVMAFGHDGFLRWLNLLDNAQYTSNMLDVLH